MGKSITNNALPSEEGTTADAVLHLKWKKKILGDGVVLFIEK